MGLGEHWWGPDQNGNWLGAVGLAAFAVVSLVTSVHTDELSLRLVVVTVLWVAGAAAGWMLLRGRPAWTLLMWPLLLSACVLVLNRNAPVAAALVVGIQTIGFLYIGLTQRPLRFLVLMPVAWGVAWLAYGLPPAAAAIRLAVATVVWVISAEFPARLLRRLAENQRVLAQIAHTDVLTGLANRTQMHAAIAELDDRSRAGADPSAIVLIDLDHFKGYNDTAGHLAGDSVLAAFGRCLAEGVRPDDSAYRFGGEEFLLLLPHTDVDTALELVGSLRSTWRRQGSGITFSAGVATSLQEADGHLLAAKRAGRDVVVTSRGTHSR